MKYVSESGFIFENRMVVVPYSVISTHPKHITRKSVESLSKKYPNVTRFKIYVVNEIGEIWKYDAYKNNEGKYFIKEAPRPRKVLSKNDLDLIFNKGVSLYDMLL